MTTTELMIGNWVLDTRTNKPLRVNPFMSELEVPTWKPIPITHEILEKNGFKKNYCLPTYKWQNLNLRRNSLQRSKHRNKDAFHS